MGVSERAYIFRLYPVSTALPDKAAVYIYVAVKPGFYTPLYIGQTDTLNRCVMDLRAWHCVNRHFVNAIGVHFEEDLEKRVQIMRDLMKKHYPICQDC